ncbi:Bacteriophage head-tail adaptor [Serratia fonticola]|uniref:phage head closure protein n=1 Tax=Serratia fonticola TaxID=47917 RepID=UPI000BA23317|nr:phage head closure protein [Serratia fonticola]PAA97726.1 head-tail adaptor protein [Serratia fonticola]CAI2037011.1 Bacteriophage head-tail adaptor [Serratia fonticola]
MAQTDFSTASVQAGRLRHRVTIQNFVTVELPSGQEIEEWREGKTVWAEVMGISGRELVASGAEKAEATVRVWMRYRTDVTAASRLLCLTGPFRGSMLEITGPPIPDTKGRRLEILCKSGVKP